MVKPTLFLAVGVTVILYLILCLWSNSNNSILFFISRNVYELYISAVVR